MDFIDPSDDFLENIEIRGFEPVLGGQLAEKEPQFQTPSGCAASIGGPDILRPKRPSPAIKQSQVPTIILSVCSVLSQYCASISDCGHAVHGQGLLVCGLLCVFPWECVQVRVVW